MGPVGTETLTECGQPPPSQHFLLKHPARFSFCTVDPRQRLRANQQLSETQTQAAWRSRDREAAGTRGAQAEPRLRGEAKLCRGRLRHSAGPGPPQRRPAGEGGRGRPRSRPCRELRSELKSPKPRAECPEGRARGEDRDPGAGNHPGPHELPRAACGEQVRRSRRWPRPRPGASCVGAARLPQTPLTRPASDRDGAGQETRGCPPGGKRRGRRRPRRAVRRRRGQRARPADGYDACAREHVGSGGESRWKKRVLSKKWNP